MTSSLTYVHGVLIYTVHVLCSVAGLLLLKTAVSDKPMTIASIGLVVLNPIFIGGMALYTMGFLLWIYILSRYTLGIAVPIAQSLFVVVSIAAGVIFLKETLSIQHIVGISLCIIGISLLTLQ